MGAQSVRELFEQEPERVEFIKEQLTGGLVNQCWGWVIKSCFDEAEGRVSLGNKKLFSGPFFWKVILSDFKLLFGINYIKAFLLTHFSQTGVLETAFYYPKRLGLRPHQNSFFLPTPQH